jgi:4-amino-4-deoxy-L-arabinose transferase-like glycosyltransferase
MRGRLTAWAAVAVGVGFLATEAIVLNARIRDYDEGVYWQSFRALARSKPLFRSIFAPTPPAFYYSLLPFYWLAHSLTSLRLGVLVFGVIGLAATYIAGRLLAGDLAGLVAVILTATSPLYLHQSAILQADGPAVAVSIVAVALALAAVRAGGRIGDALAMAAGMALAISVGIKLLGVMTAVPLMILLLGAPRGRSRLMLFTIAGGLLGSVVLLLAVVGSPSAAFDDLVLSHLRAGQAVAAGPVANLKLLFLHREEPLEALAGVGALIALLRRDRGLIAPLAWVAVSVVAVLFYKPLFPHHLVVLTPPLALVAAVGLRNLQSARLRGGLVAAALVVATAAAGGVVAFRDVQLALIPDLHDAEMAAAVQSVSRPGEFWISDNPFAVAAADRDIPGPLVDTSGQRTRAGLLTVGDLEAARVRYDIRWMLVDSFRLEAVPGFNAWRDQHFHAFKRLGGRAVIYTR